LITLKKIGMKINDARKVVPMTKRMTKSQRESAKQLDRIGIFDYYFRTDCTVPVQIFYDQTVRFFSLYRKFCRDIPRVI